MIETPKARKRFRGKFGGMLWQKPLMETVIYKEKEIPFIATLTGDEIKVMVFFVIMGQGVSTEINYTQSEICKQLGMSRESVCRAIKNLKKKPTQCKRTRNNLPLEPILLKSKSSRVRNQYHINPEWGFKGSNKDYERELKRK